MLNNVSVSVCIVTYNQEKYIAECLESLVQQKTNFNFEIIIGEDCSTDNTRKIVEQYAKKYPNLIIPLFHKKNIGAVENIKQVYKKARGKYIAHMDGDDLALPEKLQIQFDILESSNSCDVCSHDMQRIDDKGYNLYRDWVYPEGEYDLLALYKHFPFFSHSSKMFRNKYREDFWDDLLSEPTIMDVDIHVENLRNSNIWHIGKTLGKYREGVGVSFQFKKNLSSMTKGMDRAFNRGYSMFFYDKDKLDIFKKYYALFLLKLAYLNAVHLQDLDLFKECIEKSISTKNIGVIQYIFFIFLVFPRLSFFILPCIYKVRQIFGLKGM